MIKKLHEMGMRSSHMYAAGMASLCLSCATWMMSRNRTGKRSAIERADHWGIFIGQWAPTFFTLGVALRMEETHRELEEPEMGMLDREQRARAGARAGV
ncbi:hypothetical protein ACFLIM_32155 [Nonomuraea sp. M3C6]|uniref:Uncharacterized protein n=1 Tax=Nonomuraea marmarensis TaxID=3351344 RepID=A0ABW7AKH3_9ACTN